MFFQEEILGRCLDKHKPKAMQYDLQYILVSSFLHHPLYTSFNFDYSLSLNEFQKGRCHLVTEWELFPLSSPAPAAKLTLIRISSGSAVLQGEGFNPLLDVVSSLERVWGKRTHEIPLPDLSCSVPALSPEQATFSPSACKLLCSAWLHSPLSYGTSGNCPLITTITICTHFIKLISLRTGFLHRTAQLEAHFFSSA